MRLIRKSTNDVITAAVGTIIRGKYTFVIKFELAIRLFDASLSAVEKSVHGSIPQSTTRAYGAVPSLANPATRPKITVKMIIVRNGRMIAHATPITVCL